MKRLITITLVGFLVISLTCSVAIAKQRSLSLTASASSVYYNSDYYAPDRAVDGIESTYWMGEIDQAPWWIMFDTGAITQIDTVNINWHLSSHYWPQDYDIQVSDDGMNWEYVFTGIEGTSNETRQINREARYIRLYINTVQSYYPILREFEAYTKIIIPRLVRFQGNLADTEGVPLNGTFTLTFRLYDTEAGGSPIWEEIQQYINVEYGTINVELGSVTPLDLPFDKEYWLGVEVESDGEMTPRFKLTTVPYSFISDE